MIGCGSSMGWKSWVGTGRKLWDRYGPFLLFGTVGKESYMGGQKSSIWCLLMRSSDLGVEVLLHLWLKQ